MYVKKNMCFSIPSLDRKSHWKNMLPVFQNLSGQSGYHQTFQKVQILSKLRVYITGFVEDTLWLNLNYILYFKENAGFEFSWKLKVYRYQI